MNGTNKDLTKFLNKKKTLRGVDLSGNEDAITMYQMLNISGLDYKGQVSSGFGEKGIEVNASWKVDFLDFFAPGIPALELSAEAKAKARFTKETMVVLQRFPGKVYASRISELPMATPLPAPIWDTATPIALLVLDGRSTNLKFEVKATAGFQPPVSVDELGLELSANISTNIAGKYIHLKDRYPASYPSPSDTNLTKSMALQSVVDKLLGGQSKKDLKTEVDAWVEEMFQEWFKEFQTQSPPPSDAKTKRLDKLKTLMKGKIYKIPEKVKEQVREKAIDELATEIETTLDKYIFSKINIKFSAPIIQSILKKWTESNLKSKDLLSRLTELKTLISSSSADAAAKKAAVAQLDTYVNLLQRFSREINDKPNDSGTTVKKERTLRNYLSYFNLFAFAGGVGADAKADASGGIKGSAGEKPNVPGAEYLPDPEVNLTFTLEAGASVSGEAQVMSYRFQSYGYDGGAPMVYTQDSWITYRRLDVEASAMGSLDLTAPTGTSNQQVAGSKGYAYYSMTYQSICRYWLHPSIGADGVSVKPGNGSGLSFGMSVLMERLKSPSAKLITSISKQLRVPETRVRDFIAKAKIGDLEATQFPAAVFLESSFAFPDDTKITLKKKTAKTKDLSGKTQNIDYYDPEDGFKDLQIKTFRTDLEKAARSQTPPNPDLEQTLEAIRLRIRIADLESSTEPLFQLGFPVLKSALNIDISKARGAGQEALFDYHVEWYNNQEFNKDTGGSFTEAQERSVPPVVLLHQ